jgi:hypothetical protein
MKRLVLGSLLSCMVVGQISCWPDILDGVIGAIFAVAGSPKQPSHPPVAAQAVVNAMGQSAGLGGAAWLGTGLAQRLTGSDSVCFNTMRKNGRLAVGAAALGSLYKGILMRDINEHTKNLRYLNTFEGLNRDDSLPAPSYEETNSAGSGKMIGAYLMFAGLAVTARRPAALSRAWNWFSKPSSRIQE